MNKWREYTLAEIAAPIKKAIISGPFGSNISSKYFTKTGIPVIVDFKNSIAVCGESN